ncbi:OmpA family protein [Acetobacter estunensis]|uniref:OmpA family protein n=1 Tax=Acetobacter estunensis TaxID=104097 RepID=A0A967B5E6_9PROT|nr:OmpA family protein [Acetobacter estunensis]NHO53130.1 OmpA family protein [Acetobacter estunensis]
MRLRKVLLATTLMAAAPVAASATTITGPYVDVGGGYDLTLTQGMHMRDYTNGGANSRKQNMGHKSGWGGYGSFGWGFGNGLRAEVEGTYIRSNLSGSSHYNGAHNSGKDSSYGGFVNLVYDIDLKQFGIDAPVTPFIGAGAGYLWTDQHANYSNGNGFSGKVRGNRGGFAYQAIVGAAFDTGIPGFQVTAQYRMIGQPGSFRNGSYNYSDSESAGHVGSNHRFNNMFMVGLRYAFDTAPPPPPAQPYTPPPAVTPARTYLVFFDWDKSALTARARQIVAEAAQASTHVQTTRIEVNGYTDNSSARGGAAGAKYNMGLSIRRADSVKAELVRDGVPASAIDIHGYGEEHPLVPTGANTREPQNRRVEIILH